MLIFLACFLSLSRLYQWDVMVISPDPTDMLRFYIFLAYVSHLCHGFPLTCQKCWYVLHLPGMFPVSIKALRNGM